MSRSRRKVPIVGITTIESDKWFKAKEHRRERCAMRSTGDYELHPKAFGNPWASGKDGKQYCPDRPNAYRK